MCTQKTQKEQKIELIILDQDQVGTPMKNIIIGDMPMTMAITTMINITTTIFRGTGQPHTKR